MITEQHAQHTTVPIVMYHSISTKATPLFKKFTVSPEAFSLQLDYLSAQGYSPITVTDFIRARQGQAALPAKPVLLTFDDGFADFFTTALPLLQQRSFRATLYIVTAFVGKTSQWLSAEGEADRRLLTWEQIAEIHAAGIECGAHTHAHSQLDRLPIAKARFDIKECRDRLSEYLRQDTESFCYPFGYYSQAVRDAVQEAGYTSACAVRYQMSSLKDDPLALSRLFVANDITLPQFARLVQGYPGPGNQATDRAKSTVWRFIRHAMNRVGLYNTDPGTSSH